VQQEKPEKALLSPVTLAIMDGKTDEEVMI